MIQNIVVPDIGDFENVEVIEVLVDVSKKIDKNDPIVTLESDKSSVEVPSTMSGTVESVKVKVGDKVSKGDLLITLISESKNEIEKKVEKKVEKKQNIPNDTEKIINEAEKSLKKEVKEEKETNKNISKEKKTSKKEEPIIQTPIDGDLDPLETREWLESLSAVLENDGKHRAQFLIKQLIEHSYKEGSDLVLSRNTPYINTIPPENEAKSPGDQI